MGGGNVPVLPIHLRRGGGGQGESSKDSGTVLIFCSQVMTSI